MCNNAQYGIHNIPSIKQNGAKLESPFIITTSETTPILLSIFYLSHVKQQRNQSNANIPAHEEKKNYI